ncbi:MAG TPA: nitroreductase/quinone reductase family protein [Acidimicrobiia bacterium]|nr:nitroreductase/quinone reductase family protein [Acidimicrobiia bacterium]
MTADLDGHSVIDLTTVGRVSGRPHTIEIWFAQRLSTIYLLSGGGHRADWVRNLMRTAQVGVRAGGWDYSGEGRIVTDPDEVRLARDAVHDKYAIHYSGDLTRWRETALPVAVDLDLSKIGRGR